VVSDRMAVVLALLDGDRDRGADRRAATGGAWPGRARPGTFRAQVHQAAGMISVQLGVSLAEALVRLRARAFAEDRLIAEVAADVVARRLRFGEHDR
jgi:hypothetical protein